MTFFGVRGQWRFAVLFGNRSDGTRGGITRGREAYSCFALVARQADQDHYALFHDRPLPAISLLARLTGIIRLLVPLKLWKF